MTGRQVEVVAGDHVVASAQGAVAVVPHRGPSRLTRKSDALQAWYALRALITEAAANDGDQFGRVFAKLATKWSAEHREVDFGVVSPAPDGYALFLRGGVAAVIKHNDEQETFRGTEPGLEVMRPTHPGDALYLAVSGDDSPVDLPADRGIGSLVEGIAVGSGAVVWLAEAEAEAEPIEEPQLTEFSGVDAADRTEVVPRPVKRATVPKQPKYVELKPPEVFESFTPQDVPPPRRDPLPVKTKSRAQAAAPPDRPKAGPTSKRVLGVKCARGHHNDPRVAFCRVCGLRMNQTKVISEGERPPLGFLVLDDGTTFVLQTDLVVGREPEASPPAQAGATPIRLPDSAGRLSRAHAEFRLIEWDVAVVDLGSTNGTFVKPPGHDVWQRLTPHQPLLLQAGSEVQIGGRRVTFDSPHAHL